MVNGNKRKKYFRHKNTCDVDGHPMSDWHSRLQSFFPKTEIDFPKVFDEQIPPAKTPRNCLRVKSTIIGSIKI
jgi:hypothetical protein